MSYSYEHPRPSVTVDLVIFTIADNAVFLDPDTRTMRASGNPRELLKHSTDPAVQQFLTRGEASAHPSAQTS